ncbi:MAG: DNA mismatch repair endonuclease MutH [Legionella sp.]|nr:DNA mismatch repair endonuclease MutH [Legionella sp.]
MSLLLPDTSPRSEDDLLKRCELIEGLTFSQLASMTQFFIPAEESRRKGWAGNAIEIALGTTAGTKSLPDFNHLGIELKTIPFNTNGKPSESTFVTSIPLLTIHHQKWHTSSCYQKLKRVLWVPVEGDKQIPFEHRRIGRAYLWSPGLEQENILARDWLELSMMIGTGKLEDINASMGEYLQVRPKGANARSLCYGFDSEGNRILTLPRGFYLRSRFTQTLF